MAKPNQTLVFVIVDHEGTKLFFEPMSRRATGEIFAIRLPSESEIELRREGSLVAKANSLMSICGDKSYESFFHGPAPLVTKSSFAERSVCSPQVYVHDDLRLAYGIQARSRGLRVGDEVHIKLKHLIDEGEQPPKEKSLAEWCKKLTEPSAEAAAKSQKARRAEEEIYRILGGKRADRFFDRHGEEPPYVQLQLAKKLASASKRRKKAKQQPTSHRS